MRSLHLILIGVRDGISISRSWRRRATRSCAAPSAAPSWSRWRRRRRRTSSATTTTTRSVVVDVLLSFCCYSFCLVFLSFFLSPCLEGGQASVLPLARKCWSNQLLWTQLFHQFLDKITQGLWERSYQTKRHLRYSNGTWFCGIFFKILVWLWLKKQVIEFLVFWLKATVKETTGERPVFEHDHFGRFWTRFNAAYLETLILQRRLAAAALVQRRRDASATSAGAVDAAAAAALARLKLCGVPVTLTHPLPTRCPPLQ